LEEGGEKTKGKTVNETIIALGWQSSMARWRKELSEGRHPTSGALARISKFQAERRREKGVRVRDLNL